MVALALFAGLLPATVEAQEPLDLDDREIAGIDPTDLPGLPSEALDDGGPEPLTGGFEDPGPATPSEEEERAKLAEEDPTAGYDEAGATPVEELVELRTADTETWRNVDGSTTVRSFSEERYFQPEGSKGWSAIDPTVVADDLRPGWFRNAAGPTTISFGPLDPDGSGGLEVERGDQRLGFVPADVELAESIDPQVDGSRVTYRDVWPGVDVVYTVSNNAVKEDLVVKEPTDKVTYEFVTSGNTSLSPDATSKGALRSSSDVEGLRVLAPEVTDKRGAPAADAKPIQSLERRADGRSVVALSVDSSWMKGLKKSDFPVRLDPTVSWGPVYQQNFWEGGGGDGINSKVGDPYATSSIQTWRSVVRFPHQALIDMGRKVQSAKLKLSCVACSPGNWTVNAWWVTGYSWADAAPTIPNRGVGSTSLGTGTAEIDATGFYQDTVNAGDGARAIGLSGDEWSGVYTYKQFNTVLDVVYDTPPPMATPVAPVDEAIVATTSPTLSVNSVVDAEGQPVQYYYRVSTQPGGMGQILNSGYHTGLTSWTVPAGTLVDGGTYWWKVYTWDGVNWLGAGNTITTPNWERRFRIDLRLGDDPVSPMEAVGPAKVNLSNGNLTTGLSTPTFPTIGGDVGVSLAFNSQQPSKHGLTGTYTQDWNNNRQWDSNEAPATTRLDPQVDFDWGTGSAIDGVLFEDNILVRWIGYITVPTTGTYTFGTKSDDGVKVVVNGNLVRNDWVDQSASPFVEWGGSVSLTAGVQVPIRVTYYDATGPSKVQLWVNGPGGASVVPASWLRPEGQSLPD